MSVVEIAGQYGWDFDAPSSEDRSLPEGQISWIRPSHTRDILKERRCRVCLQINFHALFQSLLNETTIRWRGLNIQLAHGIRLGSLARIKTKTSCRFCCLIISNYSAARQSPVGDDETDVWLSNTAATNEGQVSLKSHTKRQGPVIVQLQISVGSRALLADPSYGTEWSTATFKLQQFANEHQTPGPPLTTGLPGLPPTTTYQHRRGVEFWRLIKWIDACQEADTYRPQSGDKNDSVDFHERLQLYSRVIDLNRRRIIRAPKNCRYVALSYVWGGRNHLQLTTSNERNFMQDGSIPFESFPRTIRDAIDLCRELGERYLWCDSMCILQNSQEKHVDIKSMEAIYRGAVLSIVAAAGDHADFGIPGISAGPYEFQQQRINMHEEIDVFDEESHQPRKVIQMVSLVNVARGFEASVDDSVWNTRAWTYQERLLSRRIIFFTKDQIYFQCDHGRAQGDCGLDPHDATYIRHIRSNEANRNERYRLQSKRRMNFSIYSQVVQEYAGRQLSFPTDIENAFAGISKIISLLFGGTEVLYGVPLSSLAIALLWSSKERLHNRMGVIAAPSRYDELMNSESTFRARIVNIGKRGGKDQPSMENFIFPSWSWVGWIGAMEFREVKHLSERTISRIEWLDPLNKFKSLPEEHFGGRPSSDWRCMENWARQVTPTNDIYYTQRGGDPQHWFCHPMEPFIHDPIPISRDTGTLYFQASVASFSIQRRFDDELAIYDAGGKQVGIVTMDDDTAQIPAPWGFDFVKLSQTTLKEGRDDPAWDPLKADYLGVPGGPAVNPSPNVSGADRIFDTTIYDANICWCLYNVLVVRGIGGNTKRIGIGKVHIHAFDAIAEADQIIRLT